MPRPDERERRRLREAPDGAETTATDATAAGLLPSKTRRKAEMHALQELGEALTRLDPARLAALAREVALPERLVDAVRAAQSITAWGARKRQLQFVGRLMRDVDPVPIRHRLELWAQGHAADSARQHVLERWRDRLIAEPTALDLLAGEQPRLDRPRFRALIAKARDEQARGQAPRAYRELFRALKALDAEPR